MLDEQGLPKLVHIKTQGQDGDNTLVSDGLEIGQKVLTSGYILCYYEYNN